MSGSIKLKHASGNGVIIAAPSSNPAADRTLTLPSDADGVIAKTDASGNLAVTGDLTVDTDTLKVDSSNNRVGIGTTPDVQLDINGDASSNTQIRLRKATAGNFTAIKLDRDASGTAGGQLGISGASGHFVTTSSQHDIVLKSEANLLFGIGQSEKMRIDSSGNVGIGTTPAGKLHLNSGTSGDCELIIEADTDNNDENDNPRIVFRQDGGQEQAMIGKGNNQLILANSVPTDGGIIFKTGTTTGYTNAVERMRLTSAGNVLIGTTSVDSDGLSIRPRQANNTTRLVFNRANTSDNGTVLQFLNNTNTVGTIRHTDSSTTYNTSSDYRLKENATAISDGITRLKTLKPYRFNFKVDASKTVDGFFAHEVTAVPEAISGEKDAVNEDGSIDPQGIDQSKLVPLLTAALQEEVAKREALEARVAALEAK